MEGVARSTDPSVDKISTVKDHTQQFIRFVRKLILYM